VACEHNIHLYKVKKNVATVDNVEQILTCQTRSVVDYETRKRLGFLCPRSSIHKLSNRNEAVRAAQRARKSTDHGRRRWNFQVSNNNIL